MFFGAVTSRSADMAGFVFARGVEAGITVHTRQVVLGFMILGSAISAREMLPRGVHQ